MVGYYGNLPVFTNLIQVHFYILSIIAMIIIIKRETNDDKLGIIGGIVYGTLVSLSMRLNIEKW